MNGSFWVPDAFWLVAANAAAGFFAASVWVFFAFERWKDGKLLLSLVDLFLFTVNLTIGLSYLYFAVTDTPPTWIRWIVVPAIVIPASLHLRAWIKARELIAKSQSQKL